MRAPVLLCLLLCLLLSCCRPPPIGQVPALDLRVEPANVTFPATFVGDERRLRLTLTNPTRRGTDLALSTESPFSVEPSVRLEAGATVELEVAFRPTAVQAFTSALVVADPEGRTLQVPLEGEGLQVPECGAAPACHSLGFDFASAACVDRSLDDGSDCTSSFACFSRASCQRGTCVGELASTCLDSDECTIDACGVDGCSHSPRTCAISDPCRIPVCDPQLGCRDVPVEDGIACGPSRCEDAFICRQGTCQQVPRPGAASECRYVDVAAGRAATCALTRGGEVKCWGRSRAPWREPALTGILPGTLAVELWTCGVLLGGSVICAPFDGSSGQQPLTVPLSRPARKLATYDDQVCATLEDDSAECWTVGADASVRLFDAGTATQLTLTIPSGFFAPPELCVLAPDGGVRCSRNQTAVPPVAVTALTSVRAAELLSLTATGERWCGAARCDSPTELLGGTGMYQCSASGGVVRCETDGDAGWADTLDAGILELTASINNGQLCALSVDARVWCAQSNLFAAAGDYSVAPLEPTSVQVGATAVFAASSAWTWVAVDGGLLAVGLGAPPFVRLQPGVVPVALTGFPSATSWTLIAGDGGVWSQGNRIPLPAPATAVAGFRALAGGHAWSLVTGTAVDLGPARSISSGELIDGDGGTSFPAPGLPPLRQLSERANATQGCALTEAGGVVCWNLLVDGGLDVETISGVRLGATRLSSTHVGDRSLGCVLLPPSGVQCWGGPGESLPAGTLPPSPTRAVDVVVGEEVVSLSVTFRHVCTATRSGRLVCWGDNQHGQLGVPPLGIADRFLPVPW